MARSIQAHASTHEKDEADGEKGEAEYSRIEEQLTQRVIIAITKKEINAKN